MKQYETFYEGKQQSLFVRDIIHFHTVCDDSVIAKHSHGLFSSGYCALASRVQQQDRGNNSFLFGAKEVDPRFTAAYGVHMWALRWAPGVGYKVSFTHA